MRTATAPSAFAAVNSSGKPGEIPATEERVRRSDDEWLGCARRECALHRVCGAKRGRLPNAPHLDTEPRPVSRQPLDLLREVTGDEPDTVKLRSRQFA